MMDTTTRCASTNSKGNPCGMKPLIGDDRCFIHSEKIAEERHEMRRRAGFAAQRKKKLEAAGQSPFAKIRPADTTDPVDLQRYISDILIAVGEGTLPTAVANTMMSGARMAIQLCGLALDVKLASKIK